MSQICTHNKAIDNSRNLYMQYETFGELRIGVNTQGLLLSILFLRYVMVFFLAEIDTGDCYKRMNDFIMNLNQFWSQYEYLFSETVGVLPE